MPQKSVPAAIYVGVEPPLNPAPTTRWLSQSHRHLRISTGTNARVPILGSGAGNTSASQEICPWWNATLNRVEAIFNVGSRQIFAYAQSPGGPWTIVGNVLGGGVGGEAGNVQQCRTYIENGKIYAFYGRGAVTTLQMAVADMPQTASAVPVFTALGTVWTDTGSATAGSPWVMKVNGLYYLFIERGNNLKLATSTAATAADLLTTPFQTVSNKLQSAALNLGVRQNQGWGRPCVFYESGRWILYGHALAAIDFGFQFINRFTCDDPDLPINWTPDVDGPVVKEIHPLEVDQVADFVAVQLANDKWWAFWSANNNPGVAFSIMTTPMLETMMSFDGNEWAPCMHYPSDAGADLGYVYPDIINGSTQTVLNRWDCYCDTSTTGITLTLPVATSHAFFRVQNAPASGPGNPVKMVLSTTGGNDRMMGPNPIKTMTASGTTVTVTTLRPHGLTTSDFVTVTGSAPSGYNVSNAAITGIPAVDQFTYTAGSSPGTNTTLGVFDTALQPGESRRYRARGVQNNRMWVRD